MFVFGGYGGQVHDYLADLWQFNFDRLEWTSVGKLQPRSRMKMLEHNGKIYIYGGWNSKVHFGDMHEFTIRSCTWRTVDTGYGADGLKSGQYSLVKFNQVAYMFGGHNDAEKNSTNQVTAYRLGRPDLLEDSMQCS